MNGNGTDGNQDMVDLSSNKWALGWQSNAQMDTGVEYCTGQPTLLLDGFNDGLQIDQTFKALAALDFTIEAFIRPTANGPSQPEVIIGKWGGSISRNGWRFYRSSTQKLVFDFTVNGVTSAFTITSVTSIPLNVWTFVVVQREGDNFTLWINAVRDIGPIVDTGIIHNGTTASLRIGIRSTSADEFEGNMGPLRVTIDEAIYNGAPLNITQPVCIFDLASPTRFITDVSLQSSIITVGWQQTTPIFSPMDSTVDVGLFRVNTEEDIVDEFSLVTDLIVGMLESPIGQDAEDWLIFFPDAEEDWLVDDLEDEDWGVGIFSTTVYDASIIGSLDGYNQYQDQFEILEERADIVDAELDETTGRSRYFTCYNNGTYHIIRIEALLIGESFHLKVVDMTPRPAGRV